jgi:peptidoglycan hydrolase-like protein with peptidoglycan-binding domain
MEAILPMVLKMLLQVPEDKLGDALASSLDANGTKWVQAALNMIDGAKLDIDGKYGPATRAAVEKFQHSHGLTVDGWAGDALCAELFKAARRPESSKA